MAVQKTTFDGVVLTVRLALQMMEDQYTFAVQEAVRQSWAYLAGLTDWPFMRQTKTYSLNLVPGKRDYEIKQEEVGYLLYIGDENDKELAYYRDWWQALRYRTDYEVGDAPVMFEQAGLVGGHKLIRFDRDFPEAKTGYLHYNEVGTDGNIDRLPYNWQWVLVHKAKSLVAPPKEIQPNKWLATTKDELTLFHLGLDEMRKSECLTPVRRYDVEIDPVTEAELREAASEY